MSCTLMIFCACVSDSEPPKTVKSLEKTKTAAAVHRAPAGDDPVARDLHPVHAEIARPVLDEHVELLERAVIEQKFDAFAGGELAALVLRRDARLPAALPRLLRAGPRAVPACPS
jgi:hypothetical protein